MARLKGLIKIEGSLDEYTFYKSKDGIHRVRSKGGVSASRIANDPKYARTRENNNEFSLVASAVKQLRLALGELLRNKADGRLSSRLSQTMHNVKRCDLVSIRGQRSVASGIQTPEGKQALSGFQFNAYASMNSVLHKEFVFDPQLGSILVEDLVPINDISFPGSATHVQLRGGILRMDFSTGMYQLKLTQMETVPLNATPTNIYLVPDALPEGDGVLMSFLGIEFLQETNGLQYALKDSSKNALVLISVY